MARENENTTEQPLILVCNDDGIEAEGLQWLADIADEFGEVFVVAPLHEQSAVGHAITVRDPVRAREWDFRVPSGAIEAYAVSGTPADCVKLAISQLLPRQPDLVVSGINQGPNTAVNVIYSGTVSAATEAAILGNDALAFSLCAWEGGHFDCAASVARRIIRKVLRDGLPAGVLLNVNIPDCSSEALRGIVVTRQARSRWEESFSARVDPFDRPYYWLSGEFVNLDEGDNTDLAAIEDGFVSVTPVHYDLTAYEALEEMAEWNWGDAPNASEVREHPPDGPERL